MPSLSRFWPLALVAAALAVGLAEPLLAAADPHAAAGAATPEKPNVFDLPKRWDLSIYTLVVFLLLTAILGRFAWPAIQKGMNDREQTILTARDEALSARREAEAIRAELATKMAQAQAEVKALLDEARRDGEKLRVTEREAGQREAAGELDRAKREIDTAKEQALTEIYQKSVQLASLMASKTLRREVNAADHGRLLDESLTELAGSVRPN